MVSEKGFCAGPIKNGTLIDRRPGRFPTRLIGFTPGESLPAETGSGSVFGFILGGELEFTLPKSHGGYTSRVGAQMYFNVPAGTQFRSQGTGILIANDYHECLPTWGGPLEQSGRLRYIDGCSDSILIYPTIFGDPCFNLLVFPPNTDQSAHTHPSFRMGVVVRGAGDCVLVDQKIPLTPGLVFGIDENTLHSFNSGKEGMTVVAYHPDSDWGPTHEVHPMINRTILSSK